MKKQTRRTRLFTLLLCCVMALGLFPTTALAANLAEKANFEIDVYKTVEQGGNVAPGRKNFVFLLRDQQGNTLENAGIEMVTNSVETNGADLYEATLTGTIDVSKVSLENGWVPEETQDSVVYYYYDVILSEQNDGDAGWTYSNESYGVRIYCDVVTGDTHIETLSGSNELVSFTNIYTAYQFTVKKTDKAGNPLAGATFSLTGTGNSAGLSYEAVSGSDGIATFNTLEGFYTLAEKTAPEGYMKSDETYDIAIWGGGVHFYNENAANEDELYSSYQEVIYVNEAVVIPTYQFTVKKTDEAGKPLAGATFSLTGTGNSVGKNYEAVSGKDGIATFDVPEGFYTLAEKTAPKGYIKSDKTYDIAIWNGVVSFYKENPENANEQYSEYSQVTYVNKAETAVKKAPKSGDAAGNLWFAFLLASGACVAGAAVYTRKRK